MVRETVLVGPGQGEVVGDSPDRRVEILSDHPSLHATWSRFGPGREGADLHVHREHTDMFFVLKGELTLRLGTADESAVIGEGELARIPPGVVHGFRNASDGDVEYLNLHAPGKGFADFLRSLRAGRPVSYDQDPPPQDGGRSVRDAAIRRGSGILEARSPEGIELAEADGITVIEMVSDATSPSSSCVPRPYVDSFYVLEGEVALRLNERELSAGAGSWIQVPPGVAHGTPTAKSGCARLLNVQTEGLPGSDWRRNIL